MTSTPTLLDQTRARVLVNAVLCLAKGGRLGGGSPGGVQPAKLDSEDVALLEYVLAEGRFDEVLAAYRESPHSAQSPAAPAPVTKRHCGDASRVALLFGITSMTGSQIGQAAQLIANSEQASVRAAVEPILATLRRTEAAIVAVHDEPTPESRAYHFSHQENSNQNIAALWERLDEIRAILAAHPSL